MHQGTNVMPVPAASPRMPGPPQDWLFGNLKEFGRDRLGTLTHWAREYGDLVSARFGPRRLVFVYHPDLVEEVLVNQNRKFIKHYRLRETKRTLGHGLLTSEGDFWRSQRKLAQPAFHRERIAAYAQFMVDSTERMLGDLERRPGPRRAGRHDAAHAGDRRQDAVRRGNRRRRGRRQRGHGNADALLHQPDRQPGHPAALASHAREFPGRAGDTAAGTDSLRHHRRAAQERRGPGRPAVDAAPRPGRGERPADDRPAAPRRGHDPVHGGP